MENRTLNASASALDFISLNQWLENFLSYWSIDSLYLFIFTPVSFFGVFLNLLSFHILIKISNKSNLFEYLKIYCLNSVILTLSATFLFLSRSRRYISESSSYWQIAYDTFVYIPIANTAYFIGSVLDIIILLDRLSAFNPTVKTFITKISPLKTTLIIVSFCIAINFPYYFVYEPSSMSINTNLHASHLFYFLNVTQFSESYLGTILLYIVYFIRDVLT